MHLLLVARTWEMCLSSCQAPVNGEQCETTPLLPRPPLQDLHALLYASTIGPLPAANMTLEGYFAACSGGAAALSSLNSLVVDHISLPCSGTSGYGPWCVYEE